MAEAERESKRRTVGWWEVAMFTTDDGEVDFVGLYWHQTKSEANPGPKMLAHISEAGGIAELKLRELVLPTPPAAGPEGGDVA